MSDIKKTGRPLSDEVAAAAEHAVGRVEGALHGAGIDPHGKAGDFGLRPDPAGIHDPIGRADAGVQSAKAAIGDAADDASDLAGQAKVKVAAFADDVRDRLGGVADDARNRAADTYDGAKTWAADVHRDNMRRIDDAVVRGNEGLQRGRTAVEEFVTENPLLVGVVGVAAGLLLGALLPRTRQEDRNLGPYADEVRDQGLRYARDFTNRGREFVQTALDPDNIQAAAQKVSGEEPTPKPAAAPKGGDRTAHRL